MNCDHTFPDGVTYDLTPLTRTAGRPDYVGKDKIDDLYYMNVCSNVQEVPKECKSYRKEVRAPVYQVRNNSYCHWLGLESSHRWDYIEPGSPYVGVQISYSNGEICEEGVHREVRMQFYCDHMSRLGSIADYYVTQEEPCVYVITFPTPYGCPKAQSLSKGWVFVICYVLVVAAYVVGGVAWNVHKGATLGVEALPHLDFWRQVPDLVKDGVALTVDWVLVALGRREPRHGGSFEWSGL